MAKRTSSTFLVYFFFLNFFCFGQPAQNMKKMAQVAGMPGNEYNDVWGYVAPDGKEYAIIGSTMAVNIFDVTNCGSPILKYQFVDGLTSSNFWRDFKTYGTYAYGVADTGAEGLEVFNLTNINNISVTQITSHFNRAHNIYIDVPNARLYVAGARDNTGTNNWMIIYSLTNPGTPTLLKKVSLNTLPGMAGFENLYIHDLYVENNIAYCSQGEAGFVLWDCTDVNNITYLGSIDDGSNYNHSNWRHTLHPSIDTQYIYVAEEVPIGRPIKIMRAIDNGNGYDLTLMSSFKHPLSAPTYTNNRPHNPYVKDNGLYIAYYHDGIQVYDVIDPLNPIRVAYYDTYPNNNGSNYTGYEGAWGVYPYLPSGCIIAGDITYGLVTLKTHFPKVELNGAVHLSSPGKGIVFRDSTSGYKRLTIGNDGKLATSSATLPEASYKIDSADLEIVFPGTLYLTAPNGSKYKINIDENGSFSSTQQAPPTTALNIPGNLLINQLHRGLIFRTANGKRYKTTIAVNGTRKTYPTSF